MNEANKKARRPAGYKPFWESDEEEQPVEEAPTSSYNWDGLKKRVIGEKTAAEVATEEVEKLKKRQGM
jgi:hypothetical protein